MSEEEGKSKGFAAGDQQSSQNSYGTFQGVANYYPPPLPPQHQHQHQHHHQHQPQPHQPVIGFPQPAPPPGASPYAYGYQGVPVQGYAVAEGRPVREPRLPCCGIGLGWFLFIVGFFLGAIPWYIGAFILLFVRVDHREKAGYVACMIASILAVVAITFGVTKGTHAW